MSIKACITDIPQSALKDCNVTVLCRVDFNVPISSDTPPKVLDTSKLRATLPTIEYLLTCGVKIILCSHLGRPAGFDKSQSMENVAKALGDLLGSKAIVKFVGDVVGDLVDEAVRDLQVGEILVLENTRFYKEEEKNNKVRREGGEL